MPHRDFMGFMTDPIAAPEIEPTCASLPKVRQIHVDAFRKMLDIKPFPPAKAEGAGILFCGGGSYWPMLVVAIRMTRAFTNLPIQVWHRGRDEPVASADVADVPGLRIIDAAAVRPAPRILRGWETKAFALVHCGWEKVLYLDADAYPVADPAPLLALATPKVPFVYWQDLPDRDKGVGWSCFGIDAEAGQTIPCVQGGQLIIHRAAFWREIVVQHWLNQHSDYFFKHGYGDQDMWRAVLAATRPPFLCLGRAPWVHPAFVCRVGVEPVIVHRCRGKISGNGKDVAAPQLPGEDKAHGFLIKYLRAKMGLRN